MVFIWLSKFCNIFVYLQSGQTLVSELLHYQRHFTGVVHWRYGVTDAVIKDECQERHFAPEL